MEAPPPVKVTLDVDGKRHTMNVDHDTSFADFKTRVQAQIPTTASHDDAPLAFYTEHGGQISKVNSTCFNWIMRGEMAADLLCSANGKPPPATKPFNIDAQPHVNAMIRSAGDDLNHIVEAIPELFDNSIAATMNVELGGTRHVWFCVDSDGGHAAVFDNGAGMDAQELEGLLRMFHSQEAKGNITPKMTADGEHACPQTFVSPYISKYGVGLKQAGFWIADHIAVRTRKATEQQRRVLEVQMSEEELKRKEKTAGENPYRFEATTHAEGVPRGECATEFHRAVLEMEKDHPHFTCIVLRVRPHNKDQLSTKAARDHVCSRLADTYAMHLHHTTFESVFKCSEHASCTHAEHQRAPLDLRVRVYDGARLGSDHLLKLNANDSGSAGGGLGGSGGAVSSASDESTEDDEAAGEVGGSAAAHRPGAACVTSTIQSAWDLGWNNDPFIFKVVFDVKGEHAITTCCHGAVLYFPYRNSAETYPGTDVQEAKDRVSCFWQGRWAPKSSLSRLPEPMLKQITKGNRKIAVDWQSRIHTFLFFNDDTPVTLNKLRLDDAVERAVQEPLPANVKRPDRKDPKFRAWLEAQHRKDEDVQYIEAFGANTIERGPWSHVRVGSNAFKAGECVMLAHSKGGKPHNNPDGPLPARIVRFETAMISNNRLPVVVATCFTGHEPDGTAAGEEISLQVDRHLKTPVLTPQELQEARAIVLTAVATEINVVCKGTNGTTWLFKGLAEFLSAGIPAGTALPGMSVSVLDGKGEIIEDLRSKNISVRRTLNGGDEHHNKKPHRSAKFEFVTTNMRKAMQHTLRFEVLVGANIAVWREFPFTVRAATPHSAITTVSPAGVKYLAGETQLSVAVRVQDAYQNDIPDCVAESSARILVRGQGQQLSLVPLSGAATEGWVRSECQDSGLELGPWTIDGKVGSGKSEVDIQLCFRLGGCELECTARDITVVPGPPASAELHLNPASVEFGESSEASVTALDKFGAVTKAQGWSVQLLVGEGRDPQLLVDDEQAITEPFEVLTGPQECIDGCGEYALRARLNGTGRQAPVMTECCDLEVTPSTAVASLQLFARDTEGREVEIGTATNGSLTIEQGSFDRIGLRFLNSEGIAANVDKSWFKGSGRNRGCVKVQKGGSGAYKSEEHDVEESSSVVLRGLKDDTHVYKIKCDFRNPWPLDPDSTEIGKLTETAADLRYYSSVAETHERPFLFLLPPPPNDRIEDNRRCGQRANLAPAPWLCGTTRSESRRWCRRSVGGWRDWLSQSSPLQPVFGPSSVRTALGVVTTELHQVQERVGRLERYRYHAPH